MILQLSTGHCRKTRFVMQAVFFKNFTSALESLECPLLTFQCASPTPMSGVGDKRADPLQEEGGTPFLAVLG